VNGVPELASLFAGHAAPASWQLQALLRAARVAPACALTAFRTALEQRARAAGAAEDCGKRLGALLSIPHTLYAEDNVDTALLALWAAPTP
jgi:hypothetical protein